MMHKATILLIPEQDIEALVKKVVLETLQQHSDLKQQPKEILYLNRKEVCSILRISLPTLWKLTKSGRLTAYKIGTRVIYNSEDVNALLRKMEFKTRNNI
jgi:excisionase family DNA binding protein